VDSYLSVALDVGHFVVVVLVVTRSGVRRLNDQPQASPDDFKRRLRICAEVTLAVLASVPAARGDYAAKTWWHAANSATVPDCLVD
jgi:hypothetical protein